MEPERSSLYLQQPAITPYLNQLDAHRFFEVLFSLLFGIKENVTYVITMLYICVPLTNNF